MAFYIGAQGTQPKVIRVILSKRLMLGTQTNKQTNTHRETENNFEAVEKCSPVHNMFWGLCGEGHVTSVAVSDKSPKG